MKCASTTALVRFLSITFSNYLAIGMGYLSFSGVWFLVSGFWFLVSRVLGRFLIIRSRGDMAT